MPTHNTPLPEESPTHPLDVVSNPSNQIYEDLTPNSTPQTSREAESIERQASPVVEENSPGRLINRVAANIFDGSRGVKRLREIYGGEFIYPGQGREKTIFVIVIFY